MQIQEEQKNIDQNRARIKEMALVVPISFQNHRPLWCLQWIMD